ncbi:PREDICTED: uncharacterized protein LOC109187730 [Ipomoea nil]|uniref:uncharacterized protein LOC109187730 n=1 Tax=Ipomoea nil TaxID=35883 RepID=UPI000901A801|nr:PREDICTED: uncharacterized protein LOC109187730 [Ipomoea nil]
MPWNWLPNRISTSSSSLLNLTTHSHQLIFAAVPTTGEISFHRSPSSYFDSIFTISFSLKKRAYPHTYRLRRNLKFAPLVPRCSSSSSNGEGKGEEEVKIGEARDALCDYLQQLGVSTEEAMEIVLAAPNYLRMLIDSVQDLDELSLWNSWTNSAATVPHSQLTPPPPPSFRTKVYEMAQQKGDKGMLPYLESTGLTLSSATHLARYLSSSHTLPDLIRKVKYLKEVLFSHSDDERSIGKSAQRMMMHLSISIDEDVQQTLSFFEKIQARRGGLELLGSKDGSFRYLIESFPRLLLLPLETKMKPILEFLEEIGIAHGFKRQILLLFPPIIFYDVEEDIRPRLHSFLKVGATDKDFGKMLLKYPWILSASILQNYERILDFFNKEKVPNASVARAIKRWPLLLGCSVDKLKLMLEQFQDLGIVNKKVGKVIATSPQLLVQKPQDFLKVVCFLKDLGVDEDTIGRILVRCPELFASSIERTLERKLGFLNDIGVSRHHFPRVIRKYPEFLVCDVDEALLPRIKYLMHAGISKRDVSFMVRRFSPLLGYSIEEVLRPKLEFLQNTMGKSINEVVDYPRYFSYSLEKKIKPRYWVLRRSNVDCKLKDMLGKNDEEFAAEFMGVGRMLVPLPPSH